MTTQSQERHLSAVEERQFSTGTATMPTINNGQELQNLLFNADAMNQLHQLASVMASSKITVPSHLQGNTGDCMAICMQAAQWRMNPFAVAQKTHTTQGGQLGYEAQLVNAVVSSIAPIESRLEFEFIGEWDRILGKVAEREGKNGGKYYVPNWNRADEQGLGIKVWATLKGERQPRTAIVMLTQCWPRFSTQWATDPQQQITYVAVKKWARRYCPDVILGVYTPDELEAFASPGERNITPPPAPEPEPYPEDRFNENLPRWRDLVASGKKSPQQIIAMVSSKAHLTEEQQEQIRNLAPAGGDEAQTQENEQ